MVAASSFFVGSIAWSIAGGFRTTQDPGSMEQGTKLIAGVPVNNYPTEVHGGASLGDSSREEKWDIFVSPGTPTTQLEAMCTKNKNGCIYSGHPDGGVPFVVMSGTETELEKVLEGTDEVEYVQRDGIIHLASDVEEDSGVEAATWGLNRIGADSRRNSGWRAYIYVQDTGIRYSHREFGNRAWSALDLISGRLVECWGDKSCASDVHGHGTNCAAVAAGANLGVAPSANLRSVRTINADDFSEDWWQFAAIDWVAQKASRPTVLSLSITDPGKRWGYQTSFDAAIRAGVVIVAAAGNSNQDSCYHSPAFSSKAITVGAIEQGDKRSSYSNFGGCTDIWAPGTLVHTASKGCDSCEVLMSGTSAACPHVSGAAALSLTVDPSKNHWAVRAELLAIAERNAISGLMRGDTNKLLSVRNLR